MQVISNARAANLALVNTDIEAVIMRHLAQNLHGELGQLRNLYGFCLGRVIVERDVAVRADQQVPGVVRVEVENHEGMLAAMHNQRLLVTAAGRGAEGAGLLGVVLLATAHVGGAVRGPQALELVRCAGQLEGILHRGCGAVLGGRVLAHSPIL